MITMQRHRLARVLIDLHSHSLHSDGTLPPCEVARRMARAGVAVGALTDHDTMAGVAEFRREATLHGVKALSGVELSCGFSALEAPRRLAWEARLAEAVAQGRPLPVEPSGPVEVHLLVFGIQPGESELEEFMASIRAMRRERVLGMAARLDELGLPLELDSLRRRLDSGTVGRPHLARLMVAAGHVDSVNAAFLHYLAEGRQAWQAKDLPDLGKAVDLVHRLGGLAIVAHPGKGLPEGAALQLLDAGVDGLEARHPSHRSQLVGDLQALCRRNRVSASAGSDFHDPNQGRYTAPAWTREEVGGLLQELL